VATFAGPSHGAEDPLFGLGAYDDVDVMSLSLRGRLLFFGRRFSAARRQAPFYISSLFLFILPLSKEGVSEKFFRREAR
jgi:hypothetical protein